VRKWESRNGWRRLGNVVGNRPTTVIRVVVPKPAHSEVRLGIGVLDEIKIQTLYQHLRNLRQRRRWS